MTRRCEVCGDDTSRDYRRCTNNRCGACHVRHCSNGGPLDPQHGRGTVAVSSADYWRESPHDEHDSPIDTDAEGL